MLALALLAVFGIKAGLFPLYFWLPASYHTPSPAVSAIFAGLLTKVGVYAIIRVFIPIFGPGQGGAAFRVRLPGRALRAAPARQS